MVKEDVQNFALSLPPFVQAIIGLIIFPFMAFEGIDRGSTYGAIDERDGQVMQLISVDNPGGRRNFPRYQGTGFLPSSDDPITVALFKSEYETLEPGDELTVFAVPSKPNSFITSSRLDESKPFIHLGPLAVSWHFPVAVVGESILLVYLLSLRKEKKRKEKVSPSGRPHSRG